MKSAPFAIGCGYDVHRLAPSIPLRLCGLTIPFEMGLEANSDGDVALHALCDALLGAAALGDIGKHFPPSDNQYKGIDSRELLTRVVELLSLEGFTIGNVDLTIMAERPKIGKYIEEMKQILALYLGEQAGISIKATTCEKLGFVGREEGMAAMAVALLYRNNQ